MSSRERRRHIRDEDSLLFANPNSLDPKTADAIGFGLGDLALEIAAADNEFQAIEAVSIHEIYPNPIQPRYSIPHDLADIFTLQPSSVIEILERWIIEIQLEPARKNFDITAYLRGQATDRGALAETDDSPAGEDEQPANARFAALMKPVRI